METEETPFSECSGFPQGAAEVAYRTASGCLKGQWKKQLLEKAASAFTRDSSQETERVQDELLKKIGELTVERDFLARGLPRSR